MQHAIGSLAAFIALIGVALYWNCFSFRIGAIHSEISFRSFKGNRINLFARNWITILSGLGIAAAAFGLILAVSNLPHVLMWAGSGLAFGSVTLNWLWPATGAANPTAAQVANQDSVVVDVTTDGTATTETLTHNLNISAADIALGFPHINIEPNSPSGIPATLLIVITRPVTANAVVLTFAAVVGTFRVSILRPHTIGR